MVLQLFCHFPAEFANSLGPNDLPSLMGLGKPVTLWPALSREKWIIRKFGREVQQPLARLSTKYQVSPLFEKKTTRLYTLAAFKKNNFFFLFFL